MNADDIRLLWDYNVWANERVLRTARQVTDVEYLAPMPRGISAGSLGGTLAHILAAEQIWRLRCQAGVSPQRIPNANDFPTLGQLEAAWTQEAAHMREYLSALSDDDVMREVRYARTTGEVQHDRLDQILAHVVLHGMQHRAECAAMLTDFGHSPGNIDYIVYLRETRR